MVQQCFAIQDTYGKTPEQLKILMRTMIEELRRYSIDIISYAFKQWRRESNKIPTPAEIIELIEKEQKFQNAKRGGEKRLVDFDGDWPAYKRYLHERGYLSPNLKP